MSNKKKIIIGLVIVIVCWCAFGIIRDAVESKKIARLKEEYQALLNESMSDFYKSDDFEKYKVSNVDYTVTDLKRSKSNKSKYVVSVIVDCYSSDSKVNEYSLAWSVEDYVPGGLSIDFEASTGETITLHEDDKESEFYREDLLTVNVNGKYVTGPKARTQSKSNNDAVKKCPVCGREFEKGTDDSWSITMKNMCEQCYENFETANKMLGK